MGNNHFVHHSWRSPRAHVRGAVRHHRNIVVFGITLSPSYAHDLLTDFMEGHGFVVTRHYLGLQTAWRAEFTHGNGGRTIGINAEMDALPLIGHACGHNLIAVSGVGVAIAIKSALLAHDVASRVVLLGTPGKLKLTGHSSHSHSL